MLPGALHRTSAGQGHLVRVAGCRSYTALPKDCFCWWPFCKPFCMGAGYEKNGSEEGSLSGRPMMGGALLDGLDRPWWNPRSGCRLCDKSNTSCPTSASAQEVTFQPALWRHCAGASVGCFQTSDSSGSNRLGGGLGLGGCMTHLRSGHCLGVGRCSQRKDLLVDLPRCHPSCHQGLGSPFAERTASPAVHTSPLVYPETPQHVRTHPNSPFILSKHLR